MKLASRISMVLALFCAALLGGFMATAFAPQPVQAAPLQAFGMQLKLTTLPIPNVTTAITGDYSKVTDIGTFTVQNSVSLVEVTHQGRLRANGMVSATGVYFELRVDDLPPLPNSGQAIARESEMETYVPLTFSGYWQNLAPGDHTVSIWARTAQDAGTATAHVNPGGWSSNDLIIKEYLPSGSVSLPLVQN